ncbi:MAG: 5-formyltetrahydrofolate cyclo-ligase [Ruminococcus sp.]|jgi:5,10-methenyltetrahydrofolate synthetase|nr:5-formyltetrahydrofolate cyclo-ligase [Ruminococcus sp.]
MLELLNNLSKTEIRKICLNIRNGLSTKQQENYTRSIWEKLYSTDEYKSSNCVLAYASIGSEPSTSELINRALSDGKRVFCPRICGDNMEFVRIEGISELKATGKYNIPEPQRTPDEEVFEASMSYNSICIVPALSADINGTRLGYGKGFYDRYFSELIRKENVEIDKIFLVCGIFSSLVTKCLPKFDHDISADMIITEEEVYKPRNYSERFFI